jgi:hypothetical protein
MEARTAQTGTALDRAEGHAPLHRAGRETPVSDPHGAAARRAEVREHAGSRRTAPFIGYARPGRRWHRVELSARGTSFVTIMKCDWFITAFTGSSATPPQFSAA